MHTKGPWEVGNYNNRAWFIKAVGDTVPICGGQHIDKRSENNAALLILAPTAPHDCENVTCPGAVNEQKLEAFDALLNAAKNAMSNLQYRADKTQRKWTVRDQNAFDVLEAAIAKAEGGTT